MPTSERADAYDHPLLYDILNTPGTAEDATVLQRIARRYLAGSPVWLEPACGTGRFVRALARRKQPALGIDLNPGMIAFASADLKRRSLTSRAAVLRADMSRMNAAPIRRALRTLAGARTRPVAAFCLHNTIRHLTSDRAVIEHLSSLARLIGPRSIYIVGIGLLGPEGEIACETIHYATRGRYTLREVCDFVPPDPGLRSRTEHAYRVLSVSTPDSDRDILSRYTLRTYTLKQWHSVLARAGMHELAVTDDWGEPLPPSRCKYALRILRPA